MSKPMGRENVISCILRKLQINVFAIRCSLKLFWILELHMIKSKLEFEGVWYLRPYAFCGIFFTGTPLTYTHWASGQPSSLVGGLEDCALLQMSSDGTWHDYPCEGFLLTSQHHGWVCKYGKLLFVILDIKLYLVTKCSIFQEI